MNKYFIIIVIICCFISFGCSKQKQSLSDKYYNIDIEEVNLPLMIDSNPIGDFKAIIHRNSFWNSVAKYMYSPKPEDHYFKSDYLEIEFERLLIHKKYIRSGKCLIGIKDINNKLKGFYIFWMNEPLSQKNRIGVPLYEWEIGHTTDTLYSNIDLSLLEKLYPKFEGVFIKKDFNKIILDYKYKTFDLEFYDNIRFDDYKFGYGMIKKGK